MIKIEDLIMIGVYYPHIGFKIDRMSSIKKFELLPVGVTLNKKLPFWEAFLFGI